ncbi:formin-like protein 1 [Tanacetum coccineum]
METMEQYMSKTCGNYGSGVVRPNINDKTHIELKGQYLKELRKNTFRGLEHEDTNEHIEKVLEIVDLFHIPEFTQDQVMLRVFPMSLTGATSRWLRNELTSSKARSTETSDGLDTIQAQLNNLGREIKKVNEKVYAAQVGCELCKGPHYTKDCPLKKEGNTLEEAYYTQFGAPYQPVGQYKAAGPGFYKCNNGNSPYPDRRQTLEESFTKFMAESAKRHKENSNIIKEIRASIDAAIRNQGASIKT